jgi:uncharacterized protein YyaL (SSP411 family)
MANFSKNNLDHSSSPYLFQHKDNPIHWQEWNKETLNFAKDNHKLIFVSIGYSTCHWCHVMAREAFSDQKTANFINKHFVAIKVDREQRPEIDSYFMNFINKTGSRGGWPLNIVLSPDQKPFFAGTYFPQKEKFGLRTLLQVLQIVKKWYKENKNKISDFNIQKSIIVSEEFEISQISKKIEMAFDKEFGGFGYQTKFPPHNTLLFLLNLYQETCYSSIKKMIIMTLDKMADKGLHDHLQGGFFRYCVDRRWQIPHFEKMLYDQAMLLWVFSIAYKLFQRQKDRRIVEKIVKNLKETFSNRKGLFYSAHDADTDHKEGDTYTWTLSEIMRILKPEEYALFNKIYDISGNGNFEGKNHLIKKDITDFEENDKLFLDLEKIEEKLLIKRKDKPQPFVDKKILTSWNSLLGIGLIFAYRYLGDREYREIAVNLFDKLIEKHLKNNKLVHSSLDDIIQKQEFLEDYSGMLLFASYLFEDFDFEKKKENPYLMYINFFYEKLDEFKKIVNCSETWFTNISQEDFRQIQSSVFDSPTPSPISLTEMAIFRTNLILDKNQIELGFYPFLESDFHNLTTLFSKGRFHLIHSPEKIDYKNLPINCFIKPGKKYQSCSNFICKVHENKTDLINNLLKNKN